jgi:hypothetical protein
MSFGELDAWIASVRRLGAMPEDVAQAAAPLVQEALRATAAAGSDPDGHAWQPKKNGGAPLVHAADHIHTSAVGSIVRTALTGKDVFHHFGATKGGVRRQILPDPGTIPPGVAAALDRAAEQVFARAVA